jgi:GAF domain-containing protein
MFLITRSSLALEQNITGLEMLPNELIGIIFCLSTALLGVLIYFVWKVRKFRDLHSRLWTFSGENVFNLLEMLPQAPDGVVTDHNTQIASLTEALHVSEKKLADCTDYLQMLYDVTAHLNQQLSLDDVVRVAVESIWQAAEIDFVALVLGENELGPFRYAGIRGVDDPLSLLDQECAVPLWGLLAQALVNRPNQGEPDYLVVQDIAAEGRPASEEFPWKADTGCFMVIPLRYGNKTLGALLFGSRLPGYFNDLSLCDYLYAVAGNTTRAIQETQSRLQSHRWIKQLISLQVFTRTITRSHKLEAILEALNNELVDLFGDVALRIFLSHPANGADSTAGTAIQIEVSAVAISLELHSLDSIDHDERQFLLSPTVVELIQWVVEAEQPLFFEPAIPLPDADDLYYRSSGRGVLIPIGETLGVMMVAAPNRATPFDESDMIVMRTIANSAAIALNHPRHNQ